MEGGDNPDSYQPPLDQSAQEDQEKRRIMAAAEKREHEDLLISRVSTLMLKFTERGQTGHARSLLIKIGRIYMGRNLGINLGDRPSPNEEKPKH